MIGVVAEMTQARSLRLPCVIMDNNAGQPGAFVTTTTTNNITAVLDV